MVAIVTRSAGARAGLQDGQPSARAPCSSAPPASARPSSAWALHHDFLFDDDQAMVRIDMSGVPGEAQRRADDWGASGLRRLRGGRPVDRRRAPAAVLAWCCSTRSRRPTEVLNVLLQLLGLTGGSPDGEGRPHHFRQTVVIMTSNVGSHALAANAGRDAGIDEGTRREVMDAVREHFRPEFLNRVDEIILFHPLGRSHMGAIVDIQLAGLVEAARRRKITVHLHRRGAGAAGRGRLRPGLRGAAAEADDPAPAARSAGDEGARGRLPRRRHRGRPASPTAS